MMPSKNKQHTIYYSAFTIVELLVVIVVIGILATIVIVSYAGISNKATTASLQSDLSNASKQLKIDQVLNSAYPDTLASANGGKGIPASSGTAYQYIVNNSTNPQSFCITATKGINSYRITNDSTIVSGDCTNFGLVLQLDAGNTASYPSPFNGTSWADLSGLGNNGTLNGGVGYSATNGGTLVFDGVDDYVNFSSTSNIPTGNSDRTLSIWIKPSGGGTTDMYPALWIGSSGSHNVSAIGIRSSTNYLAMTFWADELDSNILAASGSWFNLVGTYTGATRAAKLYINGVLAANKILASNINTTNSVYVSSSPDSRRIKATLNDPNIYNRALLFDEITQRYNATKARYGL